MLFLNNIKIAMLHFRKYNFKIVLPQQKYVFYCTLNMLKKSQYDSLSQGRQFAS